MKKYFIGLSVTYHDSALAIVDESGEVLFAEATERYLQNKRAINCEPDQLNQIGDLLEQYCSFPCEIVIASNWQKRRSAYENLTAGLGLLSAKGLLRADFKRLKSPLENYQLHHMLSAQRSSFAKVGINLVRRVKERYPACKISFHHFNHHLTHAAMACFSSPFPAAACAVIDAYGEKGSMAFYQYKQGKLKRIHETKSSGSLGFLYMKITELCGFDWLKGEEWKIMGLAPYGQLDNQLLERLRAILAVDGFDFAAPKPEFFAELESLNRFQQTSDDHSDQAADIAYTGQYFFAELMSQILQHLQTTTGATDLALTGGCALNSSFNGQITKHTDFKRIHIPSAPADDGTALGAAWLACQKYNGAIQARTDVSSPYSGSTMNRETMHRFLEYNHSLEVKHCPENICERAAEMLASGSIIGWVQGRAEFGPRALGNRSILADPRTATTKDKINNDIKFREYFRPFAPAVLHEYGPDYFENYQDSPYMDKTLKIKEVMRDQIAATCHIDGTGRLQTVTYEWNPRFYQLISYFHSITDIPVLLNTSFNVMGKPLIHTFEDALSVFLTTGLDALVVDDYVITKAHDRIF